MEHRKEIDGATLLRAIDLANIVRRTGDFDLVEDLVPGYPGNPRSCVLAATFNCECLVRDPLGITDPGYTTPETKTNWQDDQNWYVYFREKKFADALAKELDAKVWEANNAFSEGFGSLRTQINGWAVHLPSEVAHIAGDFDLGRLPSKYYAAFDKKG